MTKVTKIHPSKQPRRPHFIRQWADKRNLSQADLAREIGADKSLVSRWYDGASPGSDWQEKLAAYFDCEPDGLFRDPDEDWMARFLKNKSPDDRERAKAILIAAFPDKDGTRG